MTADDPPTVERRFVVVSGLTVFDAVMTVIAVGLLGGVELNPLVNLVVAQVGIVGAMVIRAVVGIAAAGLLALFADHPKNRFGARPLRWATVLLGLLAMWHVVQLASYLA